MKIDRNIRKTRSEEEAKKAKKQGWITVVCFVVVWLILNKIRGLILKLLTPVSLPVAVFFSRIIAIGLAVFILLVLYRYSKDHRHTEE